MFTQNARAFTILFALGFFAGAPFERLAAADSYQIRVHVLGIVGHKGYETITRPIAGATITTTDPLTPKAVTDGSGWAALTTRFCEVAVTAAGFEPARRAPPADVGPNYCEQSMEVELFSTALLIDPKLRRLIDVRVYDAQTQRGISGVSVGCVLYYEGSGKPRLTKAKLTDARGRTRIEGYFRLQLDSNHWWQPMNRIDLATSKRGYADQIDTLVESPTATSRATILQAETALEPL